MRRRKELLLFAVAAVCLVLPGPARGGFCFGAGRTAPISGKMTLVKGQTVRLLLKKTSGGKKVRWRSSRKKVASVSKNGTVKARKAGKTVISAAVGGKKKTCVVTVESPVLNRKKLELPEGGRFRLKLLKNTQKITWKSRDPKTASVSWKGLVRARKAGRTEILAATASGKTFACRVIVRKALKKGTAAAKTADAAAGTSADASGTAADTAADAATGTTADTAAGTSADIAADTAAETASAAAAASEIHALNPDDGTGSLTGTEKEGCMYRYELKLLNRPEYHLYTWRDSAGNRAACEVVMFLKTDNPDRNSLIVETGREDGAGMGLPDYADIRDPGPMNTYLTPAAGGYVFVRGYSTAGVKTVSIREKNNQDSSGKAAEISFEVLDGEEPFRAWREDVLRQTVKPGMNDLEKAEAIRDYIRTEFSYLRGTAGYPVFFTFDVGAGWETRLLDCGGAADYMTFFMRDLHIVSQVMSYPTQAGNEHSVNRIFYEGEWVLMDAQPQKRTGISDFAWSYVN